MSVYRIFGAEVSPYSVKVRSYFRYKAIPHQWIVRSAQTMGEYQKYARIPIIPLLVTPDDQGIQDSTPILEALEAEHAEPSIHPKEPAAAFLSALLEEFGDEWGNKWMFHLRWAREVDQQCTGGRIARSMLGGANEKVVGETANGIIERMLGRVGFVGSSPQTAEQIEDSFRSGIARLDAHLAERPYLFGARPCFGDFGLWGQVYNAWTDPTGGAFIEGTAPNVLDWVQRMTWPRAEGDFDPLESLLPTLEPFLSEQVGALFLPWTLANAQAIADGADEFSVALAGRSWTQKPQKYHAKSLAALRAKYAACDDRATLDPILDRTGCLDGLRG